MADVEIIKTDSNGSDLSKNEISIALKEAKQEEDSQPEKGEKDSQEKSDLSKLENDIIRQVEYYFSENNMRRDKFLNQKISENEEKWIDISVLLTFKRLQAITEDPKTIVDALEKSPNGTVQISDDRLKLRRHPDNPLPEFNETRRKELQTRTAYAKGFPLDSDLTTLIDYFHDNFKGVEQVVMRKYFEPKSKKYLFKGSVFVTFKTRELADEFITKPELKYKEKELLRYTQAKYIEVKKKEREEREKSRKPKKNEKEPETETLTLPKSALVKFTLSDGDLTREDIKSRVLELDSNLEIAFVTFQKGEKEGQIRFNKENEADKFIEKLEGGIVSISSDS